MKDITKLNIINKEDNAETIAATAHLLDKEKLKANEINDIVAKINELVAHHPGLLKKDASNLTDAEKQVFADAVNLIRKLPSEHEDAKKLVQADGSLFDLKDPLFFERNYIRNNDSRFYEIKSDESTYGGSFSPSSHVRDIGVIGTVNGFYMIVPCLVFPTGVSYFSIASEHAERGKASIENLDFYRIENYKSNYEIENTQGLGVDGVDFNIRHKLDVEYIHAGWDNSLYKREFVKLNTNLGDKALGIGVNRLKAGEMKSITHLQLAKNITHIYCKGTGIYFNNISYINGRFQFETDLFEFIGVTGTDF